jgi:osmoprotectant transport system ATP-binding protein
VYRGAGGCGKTTTVKMVNRLIEPTSSRIPIDGRDTQAIDVVTLRRSIGYVCQTIGLFPHMTIAQNIATVPRLVGWSREKIHSGVSELMVLVGLLPEEYAGRYPGALSGGQRQRVGFALTSLATDEPFGALDPITRDALPIEFKTKAGTDGADGDARCRSIFLTSRFACPMPTRRHES